MTEDKRQRVDTVRLQRMVRAYRRSGVLMAAIELGLFTRIARGVHAIDDLAAALAISPLNAERLVTACVALDLVKRDGERLENAPDVARFLVEDTKTYAADWMLFTKPEWNDWGRLGEILRRPDPPATVTKSYAEMTVDDARAYHRATFPIGLGAGKIFARQVDLSSRRKILDLGGGSGAYCIAAAKANPEIAATVYDLPPVAEVAREFIAENGVADQVGAVGGDFIRDPFPNDADVAILASSLGMYDSATMTGLVAKVHDALVPGGELHLIGHMLDADRAGPPEAALWAMSEAVAGSAGHAHSVPDCIGYFKHAGFAQIAAHEFLAGMLTRICGIKKGAA